MRLTSSEFVDLLKKEFKKEIRMEYNHILFCRNPSKYKRMGLNEYLDKDVESKDEIVVPTTERSILRDLALKTGVSIKVDRVNKDKNIVILLVEGTKANIDLFKSELEAIHNELPEEMQHDDTVKFLDIPPEAEEDVVGRNGVNVYKIQKEFGVSIRALNKHKKGAMTFVISGDSESVCRVCNHILDIIYGRSLSLSYS